MSPVNHWEVLARAYGLGGRDGAMEAQRLLRDLHIEVTELDETASTAAFEAFVRFGKGNGDFLLDIKRALLAHERR